MPIWVIKSADVKFKLDVKFQNLAKFKGLIQLHVNFKSLFHLHFNKA